MSLSDYKLQKLSSADFDDVFNFILEDFLPVVTAAIDIEETLQKELIKGIVTRTIDSGFSYVFRYKNGEIAALKLAANRQKNGGINADSGDRRDEHPIYEYMYQAEKMLNVATEFPAEISLINYVSLVSVHVKHRKRGLADQIMHAGMDDVLRSGAEALGAKSVTVGSQKLFAKHGYTPIRETLYSAITDRNGRQIVNCKEGTDRVQLMFKDLRGTPKM